MSTDVPVPRDSAFRYYARKITPQFIDTLPDARSKAVAVHALAVSEQWLQRRLAASAYEGQDQALNLLHECGLLIIRALIYAARADGQFDSLEHGALSVVCSGLCTQYEADGFIDEMLTCEIKVQDLADAVQFEEESLDLYFLSSLIVNGAHFIEQNYLEELAAALHITPSAQHRLDEQAEALLKTALVEHGN